MISDLTSELIVNQLEKDYLVGFETLNFDYTESFNLLKSQFKNLKTEEIKSIIKICFNILSKKNNTKIDLVITAPHTYGLKAKPTSIVVNNLISKCSKSIIITGYSISEYADELIELLIKKIQSGVVVKLYVDSFENKKGVLENLLLYKGTFLEIYNFKKEAKSISALHAKIISIDSCESLITSANLSYNGLEKNIEIGTLIESKKLAQNINDIFIKLFYKEVFEKI